MDDEFWVVLNLLTELQIAVDGVSVESQRAVPEQEFGRRMERVTEFGLVLSCSDLASRSNVEAGPYSRSSGFGPFLLSLLLSGLEKKMFLISVIATPSPFLKRLRIAGSDSPSLHLPIKRSIRTNSFSEPACPLMATSATRSTHAILLPSSSSLDCGVLSKYTSPPAHIRRVNGLPGDWVGSVPSGSVILLGICGGKYTRWWACGSKVGVAGEGIRGSL